MAKYLFQSFLEDKRVYNLNQAYWRRSLSVIAKERKLSFQPYLNPNDSEGEKEYDANPIFEAFFPELRKAIRIIQDEPEKDAPELAAWLDSIELEEDERPVSELVIALALSQESSKMAKQLI